MAAPADNSANAIAAFKEKAELAAAGRQAGAELNAREVADGK